MITITITTPPAVAVKPDPMLPIQEAVADLGVYLAIWVLRDGAVTQPNDVAAGDEAVAAIDAALRHLYLLRSRLVTEVRMHNEVSDARADALLARMSRRG